MLSTHAGRSEMSREYLSTTPRTTRKPAVLNGRRGGHLGVDGGHWCGAVVVLVIVLLIALALIVATFPLAQFFELTTPAVAVPLTACCFRLASPPHIRFPRLFACSGILLHGCQMGGWVVGLALYSRGGGLVRTFLRSGFGGGGGGVRAWLMPCARC